MTSATFRVYFEQGRTVGLGPIEYKFDGGSFILKGKLKNFERYRILHVGLV